MGNKLLDIVGQKFGNLLVLDEIKREDGRALRRRCRCDCGSLSWVETSKLVCGHTKSCGCLRKKFRKLAPGQAVRNELLDDYKRGARSRGLCWELSREEFDSLLVGNCFYCGIEPSTIRKSRKGNGDVTYNGIDRQNPKLGYIINNVVSCCFLCNRAKSNMTLDEFLNWVDRLCNKRNAF